MKQLILYRCMICGNLIAMVEDSGVVPVCCGAKMDRIVAAENSSIEKHQPEIRVDGSFVHITVGEQPHPMILTHYIEWIILLTNRGLYARGLTAGDTPETVFEVKSDEDVQAAYALCNLHGLWEKRI